ncbi:hypothetical protein E4O05_07085 [Treponema sp. OMZ 787]|uniref:hypothetical protein n=1 Tax=Treponema sp. OMZ 787 TaxID=2563669 RepID=UPI0020A31044|nr:hypothetical protein [Treponema sp. OMZ 787]UTC61336.1 hypothetical protein E4O05_07085 [Treponema sp. OMZ 787]
MFKLLTSIVLIGAKMIFFDYVVDNPKYEFADKDTGTSVNMQFIPTSYNSLFRIVMKSPYDLWIHFEMRHRLSGRKVEYVRIKELEIISYGGEKKSLLPFIIAFIRYLEKGDPEIYNPPNIPNLLHEKISIFQDGLSFRFSKIPLDEKIDKKIQIHINMDIIYKDGTEKNYNHYIPFKQEMHYKRWIPTV